MVHHPAVVQAASGRGAAEAVVVERHVSCPRQAPAQPVDVGGGGGRGGAGGGGDVLAGHHLVREPDATHLVVRSASITCGEGKYLSSGGAATVAAGLAASLPPLVLVVVW